jgi:hypothetical protein
MAQFMVSRGGRDTFVDLAGLDALAREGQLLPADLVYHATLDRWLYAREMEELRDALFAASRFGQRPPAVDRSPNASAVAGFVFGLVGHLPLVGIIFCLCGIFFSSRALKSGHDRGLAIAGLAMSLVFLVPASASTAAVLFGLSR